MSDEVKYAILTLILVVYFSVLAVAITGDIVQGNEREYACVSLGYEGYDLGHKACSYGANPIVLYPYASAFDRTE